MDSNLANLAVINIFKLYFCGGGGVVCARICVWGDKVRINLLD